MAQENEQPQTTPLTSQGEVQPVNGPGENSSSNSDLQAECERLRQQVQRLERECATIRQTAEDLRAERDESRQLMYALAAKYFDLVDGPLTEERMKEMIEKGVWYSAEEVLNEIEQLMHEP